MLAEKWTGDLLITVKPLVGKITEVKHITFWIPKKPSELDLRSARSEHDRVSRVELYNGTVGPSLARMEISLTFTGEITRYSHL